MRYIRVLGSVSPYCKGMRNCPGYLFLDAQDKILLDCGPGITSQMHLPEELENLTVFVSHYHKDHYLDIFSLAYAAFCYARMGALHTKVQVYLPEVSEGMPGYADYQWIVQNPIHYFEFQTYRADDFLRVGRSRISFFPTEHSLPNCSIKITCDGSTLVYTGDMGRSRMDEYASFCRNADLLISESTYLDADRQEDANHLHAREAAQIARLANVKTLLLTHFWPEHEKRDYVEESRPIFPRVFAAEEGMEHILKPSNEKE